LGLLQVYLFDQIFDRKSIVYVVITL